MFVSLGGVKMAVFRIVIQILFILICIALTVLVLMQEGKSAGLGAISGAAETYWGKNKGRSMEGNLVRFTKYLAIGFMLISVILNLNVF
jgi:preprotein translocase subunit SecG